MTVPIYSIFTFGSSTNYIRFNDESMPYIFKARMRYINNRDIRQFDIDIPNEPGSIDYLTTPGKEYMVIEGTLYGTDEASLYTGQEVLRRATSPAITVDDPESDDGYLPMKWSENVDKQLLVKPLYVDIPESRKSAMKPAFRIFFKVRYPFEQSQTLHTTGFAPQAATGMTGTGTVIPTTGLIFPVGGIVFSADSGTGASAVNNIGGFKAFPTFNITAPVSNFRITNQTVGNFIEFTYNLATGSAIIVCDYRGVTATASDGTNLMQYLTAASDIENFYLKPGINNLTLTATSIGVGSNITVSWQDTWPL